MHAYKSSHDVRHWCDPTTGVWFGMTTVTHEDLPTAHRRLILEGPHLDAPLPNSRDRVRLWPVLIVGVCGVGEGVRGECGLTVFTEYEMTFRYGRRG